MSVTVTIKLASGNSPESIPLELLSDGIPIAKATVDKTGKAVFGVAPAEGGKLAIRVDSSNLDEAEAAGQAE